MDQVALEQFKQHLQDVPPLRRALAGMLLDAHPPVRLLVLLLIEKLRDFPASVLLETWHRFTAELDRRLVERHRQYIVGNWKGLHEIYERRGLTLEHIKTSDTELTPFLRFVSDDDQAWLEALIAAACVCPSAEAAEIFSLTRGGLDAYIPDKWKNRIAKAQKTIEKRVLAETAMALADATSARPASRERLLDMMLHGDLDGIARMANCPSRLTRAQVRSLCENLPVEATRVLHQDVERLGLVFAWMQDDGPLGQIAAEWVRQGDWPQLGKQLADWIDETARATRTWSIYHARRHTLKSYTKPPRLKRHLEVMAERLDAELVCSLIRVFDSDHRQIYRIGQYVRHELAICLLRRFGVEVAREKLASITPPPSGCDEPFAKRYAEYIWMMKNELEDQYHDSDPLRRHGHLDIASSNPASGPASPLKETPFSKEEMAAIAAGMQSSDAVEIDSAFERMMRRPGQVAQSGYNLAELTALGLWQVKNSEVKKVFFRLQALVARDICSPKEAAALAEQAFAIEDPTLWRFAAKTIGVFRKQDPAIRLTAPERVREILARDREKHGKYLEPLLS